MALNANALTSLADVRTQLEIPTTETSMNTLLEKYINAASNQIERYCNRTFRQLTRTDLNDGTGQNEVMLPGRPVTAITDVRVDASHTFGTDSIQAANTYGTVAGYLLRRHSGSWPKYSQNLQVTYTCGYAAIPSDVDLACVLLVEFIYRRRQDRRSGRVSISKGGETVSYSDDWPPIVKSLLGPWVLEFDAGTMARGN